MKKTILVLSILLLAAACNRKAANNSVPNSGSQNNVTQNSQNPSQGATQTDPYADWKTYTDSQYGFSFKYPKEFSIDTAASQRGLPDNSVAKWTEFKNGQENIGVVVLKNKFDPAALQAQAGDNVPVTQTTLGGQKAYQYPGVGDGPCSGQIVETALRAQTLEFSWGACETANQKYVLDDPKVIEAILASFQFTK